MAAYFIFTHIRIFPSTTHSARSASIGFAETLSLSAAELR
jgi:hypothetical protein